MAHEIDNTTGREAFVERLVGVISRAWHGNHYPTLQMIHLKTQTDVSLNQLPDRPPEAKSYWQGIQHKQLILLVELKSTLTNWFPLGKPVTVTSNDELDMASSWSTECKIDDAKLAIGIVNSNSQTHALKLYCGLESGIVLSEYRVGKHTKTLMLEYQIDRGLRQLKRESVNYPSKILWLKNTLFRKEQVEHIVLAAGRLKLMPWSRLKFLDTQQDSSAWELMERFAETAKLNPPLQQMRQVFGFYKLLTK